MDFWTDSSDDCRPETFNLSVPSDAFIALGCERGLSAYDAAYFEPAIRNAAAIAALDKKLIAAARVERRAVANASNASIP